jgi:cell division protein FtsI (penicillin-binding protein 3)
VEAKKDMMWRVYLVYILTSVFAISIVTRIVIINTVQGDRWKAKAASLTMQNFDIEAVRGNIFDANGSLLATSLPYYEVGIDPQANPYSDKDFTKAADSLSSKMTQLFPDRTKRDYLRELLEARNSNNRYLVLKRNVSFKDLQTMKQFPIIRLGKYKGGFIYIQTNKREHPFKWLAARTVGYERESIKPIGLEGAYNSELKGISGSRLMRKIAGGVWMPVNVDNEIDPQDGEDLVSTIDINIQDVAEHALLTQLKANNASHGCAVLMEVKTGQIKAIANLTRNDKDSSNYFEDYNYAIGESRDPGSTFKLMSIMSAFEDHLTNIKDTVNVGNGTAQFYDRPMKDAHAPKHSRMSVKEIFEESSNVGTAKLIWRCYNKNPQKFIDRLYSFGLSVPLGLQIPGEGIPRIKTTHDKDWSGVSLPWMSYGYELNITPMQILTFYNAVANNGKMVKPMLVKELRKHGQVVKTFDTEVMNPAICSQQTINQAKEMLEGVVQEGTAQNLKSSVYKIAGKTGTAQTLGASKGKYEKIYQASFVGYFPAEDPQYTCIIVINAPSNGVYYAAAVAAPVFKEIADKVFATNLEIHKEVNSNTQQMAKELPEIRTENATEIKWLAGAFNLPVIQPDSSEPGSWVKAISGANNISLSSVKTEDVLKKGTVPDLSGMLAKDALYLLENNGLKVKINGSGVVARQSIPPGTKFAKDSQIILELQE